jgi:hypothetical protein
MGLVLVVGLAACQSGEQWSFTGTRGVLEADWGSGGIPPEAGMVFLCLAVIPIAVDIALLPITLPHDLYLLAVE